MDDGEDQDVGATESPHRMPNWPLCDLKSTPEFKEISKGLTTSESQLSAIAGKYSVPSRDLAAALLEDRSSQARETSWANLPKTSSRMI